MVAERTKILTKGQVTIPKTFRDRFGLDAGDEIQFVEDDGEVRVQKVMTESPLDKWFGYLKHLKGQRTDDLIREMRGE